MMFHEPFPFLTVDDIINHFFLNWPEENVKPPMTVQVSQDKKAVEIQAAMAGFEEEDVTVRFEQNVLYIEGDTTQKEAIAAKFRCKVNRAFSFKNTINAANAKAELKHGILKITLPIIHPEDTSTYIFGTPAQK